jgi:serine/threonine protein kinase
MLQWMREIASGLGCLHFKKIIHGDLKPANILLCNGVAKICDFGLSQLVVTASSNPTKIFGTIGFMAPEIMNSQNNVDAMSPRLDVWAFGSTCWAMIELENPFEAPNSSIFFVRVFIISGKRLPISVEHQCPEFLEKMVYSCWSVDPLERPTLFEIQEVFEQSLVESKTAMIDDDHACKV